MIRGDDCAGGADATGACSSFAISAEWRTGDRSTCFGEGWRPARPQGSGKRTGSSIPRLMARCGADTGTHRSVWSVSLALMRTLAGFTIEEKAEERRLATLNVKNLPGALYRKLQVRAIREHRSVAQEVTHLLSEALDASPSPLDPRASRPREGSLAERQCRLPRAA